MSRSHSSLAVVRAATASGSGAIPVPDFTHTTLPNIYLGDKQINGASVHDPWWLGVYVSRVARSMLDLIDRGALSTPGLTGAGAKAAISDVGLLISAGSERKDSAVVDNQTSVDVTPSNAPMSTFSPSTASSGPTTSTGTADTTTSHRSLTLGWLASYMKLTNTPLEKLRDHLVKWKGARYDPDSRVERQLLSCYLLQARPIIVGFRPMTAAEQSALIEDQVNWIKQQFHLPDAGKVKPFVEDHLVSRTSAKDKVDLRELSPELMYDAWQKTTRNIRQDVLNGSAENVAAVSLWDRLPGVVKAAIGFLFALDEFGNVVSPIALFGSKCHASFKLRLERIRGGTVDVSNLVARYSALNAALAGRIEQVVDPKSLPQGIQLVQFLEYLLTPSSEPLLQPLLGYDPMTDPEWIRMTPLPKMNYGFFRSAPAMGAKAQFQAHLSQLCLFASYSNHLSGIHQCQPSMLSKCITASWGKEVLMRHLRHNAALLFPPPSALADRIDAVFSPNADDTLESLFAAIYSEWSPGTKSPSHAAELIRAVANRLHMEQRRTLPPLPLTLVHDMTILEGIIPQISSIRDISQLSVKELRKQLAPMMGSLPPLPTCCPTGDPANALAECLIYIVLAYRHLAYPLSKPSPFNYSLLGSHQNLDTHVLMTDLSTDSYSQSEEAPAKEPILFPAMTLSHFQCELYAWFNRLAHLQTRFPWMRADLGPTGSVMAEHGFMRIQHVQAMVQWLFAYRYTVARPYLPSTALIAPVSLMTTTSPVAVSAELLYFASRKVVKNDDLLKLLFTVGRQKPNTRKGEQIVDEDLTDARSRTSTTGRGSTLSWSPSGLTERFRASIMTLISAVQGVPTLSDSSPTSSPVSNEQRVRAVFSRILIAFTLAIMLASIFMAQEPTPRLPSVTWPTPHTDDLAAEKVQSQMQLMQHQRQSGPLCRLLCPSSPAFVLSSPGSCADTDKRSPNCHGHGRQPAAHNVQAPTNPKTGSIPRPSVHEHARRASAGKQPGRVLVSRQKDLGVTCSRRGGVVAGFMCMVWLTVAEMWWVVMVGVARG